MEILPDFWRTEMFHPLSVHFPITSLALAFIFKLIALKFKREVWSLGGTVLLLLGTLGIWIAIYTGELADGIVSRKICDPTVLKDHQNQAFLTAWLFSAALAIETLGFFIKSYFTKKKLFNMLILVLMGLGTFYLFSVGHLGAKLVYEQAAGVNIPSSNCAEFN